jgi:hypothetical protein
MSEVPAEVADLLSSIQADARGVAQHMPDIWYGQPPNRRAADAEAATFFHAAGLVSRCTRARADSDYSMRVPHYLRRVDVDAAARYEVEAAIHFIPDFVMAPQSDSEKLLMENAAFSRGWQTWSKPIVRHRPELTDRWHDWLRTGGDSGKLGPEHQGNAAVLALACARLAVNLETVLERVTESR